MALPIWKDYYVNLGQAASVDYQIVVDSVVVYSGRAMARPGESSIMIKINEIVADYLKSSIDALYLPNYFFSSGTVEVVVRKLVNGSYSHVIGAVFYNDWSYDRGFNSALSPLSCPIRNTIPNHIQLPYSVVEGEGLKVYVNGTLDTTVLPSQADRGLGGTYLVDTSDLSPGDSLMVTETLLTTGSSYKVVESCERYALYYINAYGGMDVLAIDGNHSESDSLTRHTRSIGYDNRVVRNRGRENYVNEIKKSMTLHTSWMTDDESSRMHHLLNSANVCLYDTIAGQLIPVILKNTTTEYKTFKGNGGKLVNYTIEVEFANEMTRR